MPPGRCPPLLPDCASTSTPSGRAWRGGRALPARTRSRSDCPVSSETVSILRYAKNPESPLLIPGILGLVGGFNHSDDRSGTQGCPRRRYVVGASGVTAAGPSVTDFLSRHRSRPLAPKASAYPNPEPQKVGAELDPILKAIVDQASALSDPGAVHHDARRWSRAAAVLQTLRRKRRRC